MYFDESLVSSNMTIEGRTQIKTESSRGTEEKAHIQDISQPNQFIKQETEKCNDENHGVMIFIEEISHGIKRELEDNKNDLSHEDVAFDPQQNKRPIKDEGLQEEYVCEECGAVYTLQTSLRRHIRTKHECVRYACNLCDYQATFPVALKNHKQVMHEGVKYSCDQCEYEGTEQRNLKRHIQKMHKDTAFEPLPNKRMKKDEDTQEEYMCGECGAVYTLNTSLLRHIRSKHEGVRYGCDQCDY